MLRRENIILYILTIKISLDFLSPFRDENFAITVSLFIISTLIAPPKSFQLTPKELSWGILFIGISTIALINSGEIRDFLKFTSLAFIYLLLKNQIKTLQASQIKYIAKHLLRVFIICFTANYTLSWIYAAPLDRNFLNFEHSNNLGTYVLLSLALVYITSASKPPISQRIKIIIAAILSTSTAAAMLSMITLANLKRINFKFLFFSFTTLTAITIFTYATLKSLSPEYFYKIFGPISLILDGRLSELSLLAKHGLRIQDIGEEYNSSLSWRLYAYLVFINYLQGLDYYSLLFGSGFHGYAPAFSGYMPHNDYLLALIDFGIIGAITLLYATFKIFKFAIKHTPILPLAAILFLRLLLENNIYSFYLTSNLLIFGALLYYSLTIDPSKHK